jgi:hypothetical protein
MALLVATLKPTTLQGWSQFYRLKLMRGAKAWWEEIDEKKTSSWRIWQPSDLRNPSEEVIGFWKYSGGCLTLLPPLFDSNPDGRSVRFDKVHWNFWEICQSTTLTGSGVTLPENRKITWVMGPGVPPVRKLTCDDPLLRPTYCADPFLDELDPLKRPPVPGPPRMLFQIRILLGKASSKAPTDDDPTKARSSNKTPSHHDSFDFQIVDLVGGDSIVLHYSGNGTAGGSGLPGSNLDPAFASPQPPSVFITGGPVARLEDFAGKARMISDPRTGKMHLILESNKILPPPGTGPGLKVDLNTTPVPQPFAPFVNVGSETKGTLDFPDRMADVAEILEKVPVPLGAKRVEQKPGSKWK